MKDGMTYSDSGVDIDKANTLISRIKNKVKETHTSGVIGDIGGFGGLFAPDFSDMEEPVLVAGTDGVGTKLKIAQKMGIHDTIGIDLVAMCINDILAQGAIPLFFLDYLACGSLDLEVNEDLISGIVEGCKKGKTALIGGETAEMPGFYPDDEYELAGFAVGMVDKHKIITGENIQAGDVLLGLPSHGLHSNGFSLVRYLINNSDDLDLKQEIELFGTTLGEELLKPTRIYVSSILPLLKKYNIKGMAHITGGGLIDNLPRILGDDLQAEIDIDSWPQLDIFKFIQNQGKIDFMEMYKTFNMGLGMVLAVAPDEEDAVMNDLEQAEEKVYVIGKVTKGKNGVILKKGKEGDSH